MAPELDGARRAHGVSVKRLVDARNRVRAVVASDGRDATLTFYDEHGAESETIRGVLPVSAALFQMLNDPAHRPEIVGMAPLPSPRERAAPPPEVPVHRSPAD